jgi:phosphoribosylaminoimidazole-succinocarboxamide synthase
MVDPVTLRAALPRCLDRTDFTSLGEKYEGKVRDNYTTRDGRRYIVVTDRISAFDRVLGTVPFKGQVLNGMAAWWFQQTKDLAPNHMLGVPDPNVLECVECTPILVEMVVRAYATGTTSTSLWTNYEKGVRNFCRRRRRRRASTTCPAPGKRSSRRARSWRRTSTRRRSSR